MKRILLFFAFFLVGIALLIAVVRFIGWQEIWAAFSIFTLWQSVVIIFLTALMLFFGMWKWQVILKNQGYQIPSRQLISSYLAGFSLIYFFPMLLFGGEIFKGYALKEKFKIPLRRAMASVVIDKILEETAFVVTIFAGVIFFLFRIGLPPRNTTIFIGGMLIALISGFTLLYFKIFKKQSIASFFTKYFTKNKFLSGSVLEAEKEIFDFFKNRKKAFWGSMGLAFLRVAATWLRTWLLVLFLGKFLGILPALSVLGFYYLAVIIPIPAALGAHEIIQAFSFTALGVTASSAAAFAMLQRGAEMLLAIIGLLIFGKLGVGLVKRIFLRKIEKLKITA